MQRFMAYRIIILNGEKRGERLDIETSPLTIGRNISCDIQLPDPEIGEIHARISPTPHSLQISVLDKAHHLMVNKVMVDEASLKHGDMIEVGHTRLFVQSQHSPRAWESLTGFRERKKWITLGLPIGLVTFTALVLHQCRRENTPVPPPPTISRTQFIPDTNNTDWMVTNVAQIQIHSSIILTSTPPEIVEAKELFIQTRTNNCKEEIDAALAEIEFASNFLTEAHKHDTESQTTPDSALPNTIIQQAEESLSNLTITPSQTVSTNSSPEMIANEALTNQAESLKN